MVREPLSADQIERGRALGALLRQARAERTMVEVARCACISVETLRKIEGGRIPSAGFFTIAAIARTLGVSLDELAQRAGSAAPSPAPERPPQVAV